MNIIIVKLLVGGHLSAIGWRLSVLVVVWSRTRSGDGFGLDASYVQCKRDAREEGNQGSSKGDGTLCKNRQRNSASVLTQALHSLTDNKILKDNPAFRLGVIASINTKTSEKYYNYLGDFWMENSVTVDHSKRFPGRIASLIVELLENKKEGLDESLSLALLVLLSSITKCQSEWQWQ